METSLVETFSSEEKLRAKNVQSEIEVVAGEINFNKKVLESNYVKLGSLVNEVREKKFWLLGDYNNFGEFLIYCEKKFHLGHSQLYGYMGVSRNLLPNISESDLCEMGITKASVLSKHVEQGGKVTSDLLQSALNKGTKTDELKAESNINLHKIVDLQKGRWYDLGGFYATEEEILELEQGYKAARETDPPISRDLPEWIVRKEVQRRLAQEFAGSYA